MIDFDKIESPYSTIAAIEWVKQKVIPDINRKLDKVTIDDITYKSNTITIFLSNGTKKEIRLNIPTYLGGGGGISETRVMELINESLGNSIDAYTKSETDTLVSNAISDLDTIYYIKAETDALIEDAQNLFIQDAVPTLTTGKQALWIDTSNGNITFNLVIGD